MGVPDWETIRNPFERRSSLGRSPLTSRRGSVSSVGSKSSTKDDVDSDGTVFGVKKGREENEEDHDQELREMRSMLNKLEKTARELNTLVKAIPNTKTEIKKAIADVTHQATVVNRKCKEWDVYPRETKMAKVSQKQMTSIGIQTMPIEEINQEVEERLRKDIEAVKKAVDECTSFEDAAKILDIEWPEEAYRTVKQVEGNPHKIGGKKDIAVVMDPKEKGERGIAKDIIERYPEIKDIIEEGCTVGQIEYIVNEVRTSRKNEERGKKTVYLLPYILNINGVNDMRGIYDLLVALEKLVTCSKSKEILLVTPEGLDRIYIRKIDKLVMHGKGIIITYITPKTKGGQRRREFPIDTPTRKQKENVLIKAGGKDYAELLKSVKTKVDINKMGITIRSLRKTVAGDLLLTLEGRNVADNLGNEIKQQLEGMKVIVQKGEKSLHISDIDAATIREEVEKALQDAIGLGSEAEAVSVSTLRPTRNGNQAATITANKKVADQLTAKGKIKIGWVICRIRERIPVIRCYKCLKIGHNSQQCKDPDGSDQCYKCEQKGHRAKECKGTAYCGRCETEGHRSDLIRYRPYFRRAVEKRDSKNT